VGTSSFTTLHDEVADLTKAIRDLRNGVSADRSVVEARISGLIAKMESALALDEAKTPSTPATTTPPPNASLDEPAAPPATVAVRRVGEPGNCPDCRQTPCACFQGLSKPKIVVEAGKITISFGEDYSPQDRSAFLKSMKLVVDRRAK
jgi:hypothetical protein